MTADTAMEWTGSGGAPPQALLDLVPDLGSAFRVSGQLVSDGDICSVVRVVAGNQAYFVKRYHFAGRGLRRWLGRSRMDRELGNLRLFASLKIPVPRVVAVSRETVGPCFRRGAMITEEVPAVADLAAVAQTEPGQFANRPWARAIMRQLASYVAALHRKQFVLHDLKWRNVLVTRSGPPQAFLIDCPSGRRTRGWLLRHGVVKDLASLDKMARRFLSRPDRLRFVLAYLGHARLDKSDKRLVRSVLGFRFRSERRRERSHMKEQPT